MLLAYCEECGQQYKLNPDKIPGKSAKVKCRTCNHIFTVLKEPVARGLRPQDTTLFRTLAGSGGMEEAALEEFSDRETAGAQSPVQMKGLGLTVRMLITFLLLIGITGAVLSGVYLWVVPDLMRQQIQLRSESIAKTFAVSIVDPILVRNFLRINQAAEKAALLPGVAYVAVLNPKDVVVAGIFGQPERYSTAFMDEVKSKGFPRDLVLRNKREGDSPEQVLVSTVDRRKVMDLVVPIADTGWEAHVGVFTSDIDQAMQRTLPPVVAVLAVMAALGAGVFIVLARTVSEPIRKLCASAVLISQMHLSQKIEVSAPGEIGQLALALEAMRLSIRQAIHKLQRPKPLTPHGGSHVRPHIG